MPNAFMTSLQSLPWADPLAYAASLRETEWALLYSGLRAGYSGRYSLLAFGLADHVEAESFAPLAEKLSQNRNKYANAWFGYLGYGLKNSLENLPQDLPGWPGLPPLSFRRFHTVLEFDHEEQRITIWPDKETANTITAAPLPPIYLPAVSLPLSSNMSREAYLDKAKKLIARIHAGDLYQGNLTRKFSGRFTQTPDAFMLFRKLCATSPAAYSAFLKMGDTAVISSSPELFLKIGPDGHIRARPVKGTSPRFADAAQDDASRQKLMQSAKDRAENLMIVDLMRNDLARGCEPGSVNAQSLFEVTSHSNVHHMSSTVTGRKRAGTGTLEAIAQAFPPGSMTGAPKIMAMRLLSELEKNGRGVYSGALGWLGGDGSAELSVVIRTLILKENLFEFQIGGGIVADSTPEGEMQEIIEKSKGILSCLGLTPADLP